MDGFPDLEQRVVPGQRRRRRQTFLTPIPIQIPTHLLLDEYEHAFRLPHLIHVRYATTLIGLEIPWRLITIIIYPEWGVLW
jgi:hypothetical protein